MKDFFDEIIWILSDWRDKIKKPFIFIGTSIRWILIIIIPILLGVLIPINLLEFINRKKIISFSNLWSTDGFELFFPIVLLLFLSGIGHIWRMVGTRREFQLRLIYFALKWFYSDLGFEENPNADIRCTIWTPNDSKVSPEKIRLVQLVNYVPRFARSQREYAYRLNKNSGRTRPAARITNGIVKPIGIVGLNVINSSRDHKPYIMFENIEDNVDFIDRMINTWNFTKAEAKRLTADRRSYMSIALMDSGKTDILGIIFIDSKYPNTFTERVGDKAQIYLPRIAELLTS